MPKKYRTKGTILLLILLFSTSAGIRLITSSTAALAESDVPGETVPQKMAEDDVPLPIPTERFEELLNSVLQREKEVTVREERVNARLQELTTAERSLRERLVELEQAEDRLKETITLVDGAAEGDVKRLTTVYESMKPKDAAALFEEMDPEFAAGFLSRMRPDAAAGIMTGLEPQTAYTISVVLAGRHANSPTLE